jgi:hypothetical protein
MARRPKRAGGTLADRNMYSQSLANHQLRQDAASPDGRGFAGAVELELLERVVGFPRGLASRSTLDPMP